MQLFPDIHLVDGVTSNTYLIVEPDGLTLIDTGMPGSARKILTYLRSMGSVPAQLRTVILTHQHVDHVGGAAELAALSGAEVIAHPVDTPAIEGTAARDLPSGPLSLVFRAVLMPRLRPVRVTRQVTAGETLPILAGDGGLRVIETPGHTLGQIALYLPGRRLLFAGDTYRHTTQGEITIPFKVFNYDTPRTLASLASLHEYAIDTSLPGHGKPIVGEAAAPMGRAIAIAAGSQTPLRK